MANNPRRGAPPRRRRRKARWRVDNPLRFITALLIVAVLLVLLVHKVVNPSTADRSAEAGESSAEESSAETADNGDSSEDSASGTEDASAVEAVSEPVEEESTDENGVHTIPAEHVDTVSEQVSIASGYRTKLSDLDDQVMGFLSGMVLSHADNHAKAPEDGNAPEKLSYRYHIVIDPAHGGEDAGVSANGITERDYNLEIAQRLRTRIREVDPEIEVILTRDDNSYVELEDRIELANSKEADFYLCLRCTAYEDDPEVAGVACMFWDSDETTDRGQKSLKAAMILVDAAATALTRPNAGAQMEISEVLYETNMPSVALRMGYLTNDYDAAALTDERLKDNMVNAVVDKIVEIVNGYEPHVDVNIPEIRTLSDTAADSEVTTEEDISEESTWEDPFAEDYGTEDTYTENTDGEE